MDKKSTFVELSDAMDVRFIERFCPSGSATYAEFKAIEKEYQAACVAICHESGWTWDEYVQALMDHHTSLCEFMNDR